MRDLNLSVSVLQSQSEAFNAWPGNTQTVEFSDATCPSVDSDTPYWKISLVFVVFGFDASASDSFPAPDGWQIYTPEEAQDLIPIWAAQSLEWHAATLIECSNNPDNFYLVSDSYFDVLNSFTLCCGTPSIPTQVFALKQSSKALEPGQTYPCGTEAIFKWLAIFGNEDPPLNDVTYAFHFYLRDAANTIELLFFLADAVPFTTTVQQTLSWPSQFIGLSSIDSKTLIENDQVPGPDQYRVADFDGGTIEVRTSVVQGGDTLLMQQVNTWALPNTNCGPDCVLPYPDPLTLVAGNEGVAYNSSFNLLGDGPYQLNVITKPDWLTMTLNPTTGQVSLSGTPDDFGDFDIEFQAENCGEDIVPETPSSGVITLHVFQSLSFTAGTPAANRTWYKVAYGAGLFVAIKQQGTDAQVMTSPDGLTWTTRAVPEDLNWNDICFSPSLNLFVAVAQGGTATEVMTSPDGITWTARNQANAGQWRSVVWAEALGLFVAVGSTSGNRVMTSPDGITWTSQVAAAANLWYGVTWSEDLGLLVAVGISGSGNRIMTSPDGVTWTSRTSPADNQWRKVVWAPFLNLFVAVADSSTDFGQRVMTSPDGITWTLGALPTNANFASIALGNDLLIAVANTGGTGDRIVYSPDGIGWTGFTGPGADAWLGIAFGDNKFVIVGVNAVAVAEWFPE
jgi:hypothetical protein